MAQPAGMRLRERWAAGSASRSRATAAARLRLARSSSPSRRRAAPARVRRPPGRRKRPVRPRRSRAASCPGTRATARRHRRVGDEPPALRRCTCSPSSVNSALALEHTYSSCAARALVVRHRVPFACIKRRKRWRRWALGSRTRSCSSARPARRSPRSSAFPGVEDTTHPAIGQRYTEVAWELTAWMISTCACERRHIASSRAGPGTAGGEVADERRSDSCGCHCGLAPPGCTNSTRRARVGSRRDQDGQSVLGGPTCRIGSSRPGGRGLRAPGTRSGSVRRSTSTVSSRRHAPTAGEEIV